jgi:hypothetical protein
VLGDVDQSAEQSMSMGGGAGSIRSADQVQSLATLLAEYGGLSARDGAAELERLFAEPGVSLFVQLGSDDERAHLRLTKNDEPGAKLRVRGAASCGAARPTDASSCVLVLWMHGAEKSQFVGEFPRDTQRVSLVLNGRLVHSALPASADALELTFGRDTDL